MLRSVALPSLIVAGTSASRLFTSTTSAASIATSVPAPIAIPKSALVRAGASLMPSPTIATLPYFFSSFTFFSLPSGRTPATTSSMSAFFATAFAVFSLSPVSITTRTPIFLSSLTACLLSSFIMSATAIIPRNLFPLQKYSGVLPSSASCSAFAFSPDEISANCEIYL